MAYWCELAAMPCQGYTLESNADEVTAFQRCQYVKTRSKRRSHCTRLSVDTEHRGYYECADVDATNPGTVTLRPSISLSEALLYGLYKGVDKGFADPLTGRMLSLRQAFDCGFIDVNRSHVITSDTGVETRVTLTSALADGTLNAERSYFTSPDGAEVTALDEAKVADELTLAEAAAEGLLRGGDIVDCKSGLRFSLRYAVDHCLLSRADHGGLVIVATGQMVSLAQALLLGVINDSGYYVHKPTGLTCTIKEAVNQGLFITNLNYFLLLLHLNYLT